MNTLVKRTVLLTSVLLLPVASAAAADLTTTVGLKMWQSKWNSWDQEYNVGTNDSYNVVSNAESRSTNAWIPSLTVRYGDFMVGGSYFKKKSYSLANYVNDTDVSATDLHAKRSEADLIAGYYVLPTLAVIVGHKTVNQYWSSKWKFSGPILGVSGSAPLGNNFSLYGSVALGSLKPDIPAEYQTDGHSPYRLGELGVAYAFGAGGPLKSIVGTFGYRSQSIVTNLAGDFNGLKGRDTTEGLALGLSMSF